MIRRPPRSTQSRSSAASDVYKRQEQLGGHEAVIVDLDPEHSKQEGQREEYASPQHVVQLFAQVHPLHSYLRAVGRASKVCKVFYLGTRSPFRARTAGCLGSAAGRKEDPFMSVPRLVVCGLEPAHHKPGHRHERVLLSAGRAAQTAAGPRAKRTSRPKVEYRTRPTHSAEVRVEGMDLRKQLHDVLWARVLFTLALLLAALWVQMDDHGLVAALSLIHISEPK